MYKRSRVPLEKEQEVAALGAVRRAFLNLKGGTLADAVAAVSGITFGGSEEVAELAKRAASSVAKQREFWEIRPGEVTLSDEAAAAVNERDLSEFSLAKKMRSAGGEYRNRMRSLLPPSSSSSYPPSPPRNPQKDDECHLLEDKGINALAVCETVDKSQCGQPHAVVKTAVAFPGTAQSSDQASVASAAAAAEIAAAAASDKQAKIKSLAEEAEIRKKKYDAKIMEAVLHYQEGVGAVVTLAYRRRFDDSVTGYIATKPGRGRGKVASAAQIANSGNERVVLKQFRRKTPVSAECARAAIFCEPEDFAACAWVRMALASVAKPSESEMRIRVNKAFRRPQVK